MEQLREAKALAYLARDAAKAAKRPKQQKGVFVLAPPKVGLGADPVLPPIPAKAWTPLAGSTPVRLCERPSHVCKWPVDVDGETLFCGRERFDHRYCKPHAKLGRARSAA